MILYEPRAAEIREDAERQQWQITWRRQGANVYVTVKTDQANPLFSGHDTVRSWLRNYYKDPYLTSGGFGRWNFRVYNLIELLKEQHHDKGTV